MARQVQKPAIGVFDLGASGGRFFAATLEGTKMTLDEICRFDHRPQTLHVAHTCGNTGSYTYWDFFSQYNGLMNGLRRACSEKRYQIISVGIDTWGSDGMWLAPCGEPLGHIFSYRDHRLDTVGRQLFHRVPERTLFDRTGVPSHPYNMINQIFWATRHQPELVHTAEVLLPVPSIFVYYLTGLKVAEYTWMSTTQCCTAGTGEYNAQTFRDLALPLEKMPPIVRPGTIVGSLWDLVTGGRQYHRPNHQRAGVPVAIL